MTASYYFRHWILVGSALAAAAALLWIAQNGDEVTELSILKHHHTHIGFREVTVLKQQKLEETDSLSSLEEEEDAVVEDENELLPFWPNKVMHQYKKWHSVNALKKDPNNRKFTLIYYWCPDRAGNILHNMFNTIAWAMITNRTIMVTFDTTSPADNTFEACQDILKLKPWIPMWEDWVDKLDLNTTINSPIPIPIDTLRERFDRQHQTVIFPQISDLQYGDPTIHRNTWRDDPLNQQDYKWYIQNMGVWNRETAGKMFVNGVDFLFGMLFREIFSVSPDLLTNIPGESKNADFSLALHSRHTVNGDLGEFIREETDCLEKMLPAKLSLDSCSVYLMSDRQLTIEKLSNWLLARNCTPVTALSAKAETRNNLQQEHLSKLRHTEHGERAGAGFIQDLALASHARTGYIGDIHRSSFMLLVELMTYDRMIEAWNNKRNVPKELVSCEISRRSPGGYDYGPGTPTFRHHSKQLPTPPIGVMEQYKKWHGVGALKKRQNDQDRRYALAYYSCPLQAGNRLHHFMNSMIWAVMSNRTLLWKAWDDEVCKQHQRFCDGVLSTSKIEDCDEILQRADWIPSYNDWKEELQLGQPVELYLGPVATEPSSNIQNNTNRQQQLSSTRISWQRNLNKTDDFQVVEYPMYMQKITEFLPSRRQFLRNQEAQERAKKLYSQGADYLYGMLFDYAFSFTNKVHRGVPVVDTLDSSPYTIGLHSRHSRADNDGQDISHEISCLQPMIQRAASKQQECQVMIMSDRNATINSLQTWLSQRNCSTVVCAHQVKTNNNNHTNEHGPFAGIEFFRDLALVSKARSAFVGHQRSSSDLVLERIQYKRRQEVWKLGRDPPIIPDFETCILPDE